MLRNRDLHGSAARPLSVGAFAYAAAGMWSIAACSSEVPNYTPDADTGSRHAVITVERTESVDPDAPLTADAFAQFVRVPAYAEPGKVLAAAGVARPLPALNTCASADEFDELSGPLTALGPVEFLEAGDVAITAAGLTTALAAHAFPTVSDFASGVVYATRDQSADPLPAEAHYIIAAQGSGAVSPMQVHAEAPAELSQVTLNGVPLVELEAISVREPLDLTWSIGEPGDVVTVEVSLHDGSPSILCAFRDDNGAGTISAETFPAAGTGTIAVRRTRLRAFERAVGFDTAELRFDFQRTATVDFVD